MNWNPVITFWNGLKTPIKYVVIVGATFLVLSLGKCSPHKDSAVVRADSTKAVAESLLKANTDLRHAVDARDREIALLFHVTDSLSAKISDLNTASIGTRSNVARERHDLDSLKRQTDSVALARTVIPKQDSIIAGLDSLVANRDSALKISVIASGKKDSSIKLLKLNEDSLKKANDRLVGQIKKDETTITELQQVINRHDKFLWIFPEPSRKVVAVTTAVVTAVLTSIAVK